jgi:hypothetical protein
MESIIATLSQTKYGSKGQSPLYWANRTVYSRYCARLSSRRRLRELGTKSLSNHHHADVGPLGVVQVPLVGRTQIEHHRKEMAMASEWQYQVRFDLNDTAMAESARRNIRDPALAPLIDILAKHKAALKCQFDAFAEYVAAAEEHGVEKYPLYGWTKATIENAEKKEKYLKSFTLYVDDREVYAKEIADMLEAELQTFARSGLITRISVYDTNPANNPQPRKHSGNPN